MPVMLEPKQIEEILSKDTYNINSFFKTIKYVYKSKSSENVKELLSKNINKNPTIFVSLIWELLKYFIIALELIESRKAIVYMIFSKYANTFSSKELLEILNNPSNQWLDSYYKKIELLQYFCYDLLKNPNVCKEICDISKITAEQYHALIKRISTVFDDVKNKAFDNYKDNKNRKLIEEQSRLFTEQKTLSFQECKKQIELYDKIFEDSSLLEIKQEESKNV